jgi:SAM-dependent methyltransferase
MRVASPGTEPKKPKYDHRDVRPSQRLSAEQRDARYAEERRQGEQIAAEDLEAVWGWTGPAGSLRAERRAAFLISAAGLEPGVRALELGAGTGQFTKRLLASGCELVALELSEATADICRERIGDRAEVVVGNVETGEGLEGRDFDAIVGVSILHHVNMELCLKNTFSKLRSGGRFAFSEPNMSNPQVWAMKNVDWVARKLHETQHETAFRTRELRRLFEDAAFLVDVSEPFDFLHPKTPGRLVPAVRRIERVLERTPLRAVAGSIRIAGRRP